jgi:hypothetical protein
MKDEGRRVNSSACDYGVNELERTNTDNSSREYVRSSDIDKEIYRVGCSREKIGFRFTVIKGVTGIRRNRFSECSGFNFNGDGGRVEERRFA